MGSNIGVCSLKQNLQQDQNKYFIPKETQYSFSEDNNYKNQMSLQQKKTLIAQVRVWNVLQNHLYDYESNDYKLLLAQIQQTGELIIKKDMIDFKNSNNSYTNQQNSDEQVDYFNIKQINNNYYIQQNLNEKQEPCEKSTWIVTKSILNQLESEFLLMQGDYIKIGRTQFRIISICQSGRNVSKSVFEYFKKSKERQKNSSQCSFNTQKTEENETKPIFQSPSITFNSRTSSKIHPNQCKICLNDAQDESNPLINPCLCSGSLEYVHIQCLQFWISKKIKTQDQISQNFNTKNVLFILNKCLECELCKAKYPFQFNYKGITYDIFENYFENDNNTYLIIESHIKNTNTQFGVYFIKINNQDGYTIGRSHSSDIVINDLSVSRIHATLKYYPSTQQLYIKDNNSKFGTLVLLRDDFQVCEETKNVMFQNGRSIMQVFDENHYRFQKKSSEQMLLFTFNQKQEQEQEKVLIQ